MFKWLYYNSPTIQAFCAILGLAGLAWYAFETSIIRRATLVQGEADRRPYFDFTSEDACPVITNIGSGIALNTEWQFFCHNPDQTNFKLGAIASNQRSHLEFAGQQLDMGTVLRYEGIRITYTDTVGKKYWTTCHCSGTVEDNHVVQDTGTA